MRPDDATPAEAVSRAITRMLAAMEPLLTGVAAGTADDATMLELRLRLTDIVLAVLLLRALTDPLAEVSTNVVEEAAEVTKLDGAELVLDKKETREAVVVVVNEWTAEVVPGVVGLVTSATEVAEAVDALVRTVGFLGQIPGGVVHVIKPRKQLRLVIDDLREFIAIRTAQALSTTPSSLSGKRNEGQGSEGE